MINETFTRMVFIGRALFVDLKIWSSAEKQYKAAQLTFDTGASITTLPYEYFEYLGCKPIIGNKNLITTATDVVESSGFYFEKIMIGDIEIHDVKAYALKFPDESHSYGVLGLNVLRQFDIELLFSKGLIKLKKL